MTHDTGENSNTAVCRAADADAQGEPVLRSAVGGSGLFQRQLSAVGLGDVAEKIAAGSALEMEELDLLSRASLPLLGRIVQLMPDSLGWTYRSDGERKTDAEVHPATDGAELPIEHVNSAAELPRQIAQSLSEWDEFCRTLVDTRYQLHATSDAIAWYPQVTEPPDAHGMADKDFTGVDVLRAIALARLVLPANVQIVAPLAALGPKLAQVALEFGASHLGFVGSNGQLSDGPLAADQSVLNELRGSCMQTTLKEES